MDLDLGASSNFGSPIQPYFLREITFSKTIKFPKKSS